ncbi:MAG: hypothetical protein RBR50_06540 [Candidatus Izemoplasmatales bacterium]|nr:hypothetical protein [Candidatus Izemoplasmatales bacterium]
MKSPKKKDIILEYIKNNYDNKTPIFLNEIYKVFPEISEGTIRSLFKRFSDSGVLEKVDNGVYALPNKESVLGKATVYVSNVIENKYIRNEKEQRIGYVSGINFSNQIGLTSQTASVSTIYSNNVSNKKRMTTLKNSRLIINAPRVEVTDQNYKLLQILDLLNDFEKYSEQDLKTASNKILEFLGKIKLKKDEVELIVSKYPLEAQVKFYKIGGANAITST